MLITLYTISLEVASIKRISEIVMHSVFHIEDFVGCPLFVRGINNVNKICQFFAQVNKRNLTQCMYHNSSLQKWHRLFKFIAALSHLMHCQVKFKKVTTYPFQYAFKWFDVHKSNKALYRAIVGEAGLYGNDIITVPWTFWKSNLP